MVGPELAVAPMHRICKKAGADRVSESAARELAEVLDTVGVEIAKAASKSLKKRLVTPYTLEEKPLRKKI